MRIAMCLEAEPDAKWHFARQMGLADAVALRVPGDDVPLWDFLVMARLKARFEDFGLRLAVLEGWIPMEDIKLDGPDRPRQMENLKAAVRNMGALGIPVLCYNWMARHNWLRTSVTTRTRGGALTTTYSHAVAGADPRHRNRAEVSEEFLWGSLRRFLDEVAPVAEEAGVKLAMHPDDPPLSPVFGTGRIMRSPEAFERLLSLHPSPVNGMTFCQGNFAAMGVDVPATIRRLGVSGRIHFVHFRDVRGDAREFTEVFHDDGPTDMWEAMRAYRDIGFDGVMRPDHAPSMYGEPNATPGYEALGRLFAVGYMKGLIEGVDKVAAQGGATPQGGQRS